MKILHCCLAAFYIDGYSYQENILPREHRKSGNTVSIIASTETFLDNNCLGYTNASKYYNEDDILVTRLAYSKILPHFIMKKLRVYKGLKVALEEFNPDIIFLHDFQFIDIRHFVKFVKRHPNTKIFIDCHTDYNNSAKNWVSKCILHKIIYKYCAKIVEPYTSVFWGVLPARVDFLIKMYNIPNQKVKLLVMGAEDNKVEAAKNNNSRFRIRKKYNIDDHDFLIITGGKIDKNKTQVLKLMEAVNTIKDKSIKLLVFGSVSQSLSNRFESLLSNSINYIGWIDADEIYEYFNSGDLIFFPGLHSVLWEQAVGQGKPCVFKYIEGFNHIDLGGNCMFINDESVDEIKDIILKIRTDENIYKLMKSTAEKNGLEAFSYSKIAQRSIIEQ